MDIDKAEKFWDRLANGFDRNTKSFQQPPVEKVKHYLKRSDSVLDFGCATGNEAIEISDIVKEVKGIDISSNMIDIAKRKTEKLELSNVHFEQSTIFKKKHKKASYDVILLFNILHFFDDTQVILQRINELLKPKGLVIIITTCVGEKNAINFFQKLIFVPLIKIRKIPFMKFFKPLDLKNSIVNTKYKIVEFEKLNKSSNYFIVAKKENQNKYLIK